MPGEFRDPVGSIKVFEQVLARVQTLANLDPAAVHASATPGVLGRVVEQQGPWMGREELRFEIPGTVEDALAVGPDERAVMGTDSIYHIVALPGFEIAGRTQNVKPHMFAHGLTPERARRLAARPQLDFNAKVSKILLDVATSGDYSGSVTDSFTWSATDQQGRTNNTTLATQNANQAADVYFNGGQSFEGIPLRNGTLASAGHDHIFDTGAAWTADSAKTQANLILEHPTTRSIDFYVGSTVADDVRDQIITDYGAIPAVQAKVEADPSLLGADFANAIPIGRHADIDYYHMPDLPASGSFAVSRGSQPFHLHLGQRAAGMDTDRGAWTEAGDAERRGISYGYGRFVSAGVQLPTHCVTGEFVA